MIFDGVCVCLWCNDRVLFVVCCLMLFVVVCSFVGMLRIVL